MSTPETPLVNRVANSGLITIDLETFFPEGDIVPFDLKDYLFMGLILKEKDFREALQQLDWSQYEGKNIAVFCSADAIIPVWAYMLVVNHAAPFARMVYQGTPEETLKSLYLLAIRELDVSAYDGQRIVVKGCSHKPVPPAAYVELTRRLRPLAQSIMYGEPCSTVPVYKKPKHIS